MTVGSCSGLGIAIRLRVRRDSNPSSSRPERFRMNEVIDRVLGWGLSKVGDLATSSWGAYRMLFAPFIGGRARDRVARTRASAAFYNARDTVPAYREFLREHNAENPAEWEQV